MRHRNEYRRKFLFTMLVVAAAFAMNFEADETCAAVLANGDVAPQTTFPDIEFGTDPLGDPVLADVTGPVLPFFGGPVVVPADDGMGGMTTTPADLIVGGTGLFSGTTFEDGRQFGTTSGTVTISTPSNTLPLFAPNIYIGMEFDGLGRITLTDFGSTLSTDGDFFVGEDGDGELEIFNGSIVGVGDFEDNATTGSRYAGGTAIIGANRLDGGTLNGNFISEGLVSIDGFGSKFDVDELIVADFGRGTIEASGEGSLRTETAVLSRGLNSTSRVSLSGLFTRWDNASTLEVGRFGDAILEVSDEAVVITDTLTVNATSNVELNNGTIITRMPSTTDGIIRGSGRIESTLTINVGGQLSNASAEVDNGTEITRLRENLRVTGEVVSAGLIESDGGQMVFDSLVTNDGDLIARDSILEFRDTPPGSGIDLQNNGDLIVDGDVTIIGDVDLAGRVISLRDTTALFRGNFSVSNGILAIVADDLGAPITATGEADLSSAAFQLFLPPGVDPDDGPFALFEAAEGITPPDFPIAEGDGRLYDLSVVGGILFAEDSGVLANPMGPDLNGDGIVNAIDFQVWESNYPIASGATTVDGDADGDGDVDGADLLFLQMSVGPFPVSALATVPEPSTLALALFTIVCCPRRRVGR
ncbi:MAG: hypothetical protein AAGD11_07805 [Planctomycetota bacterium]